MISLENKLLRFDPNPAANQPLYNRYFLGNRHLIAVLPTGNLSFTREHWLAGHWCIHVPIDENRGYLFVKV